MDLSELNPRNTSSRITADKSKQVYFEGQFASGSRIQERDDRQSYVGHGRTISQNSRGVPGYSNQP